MPANHKSTQDYFGHAIILSDTHMKLIYKRTTVDGSEIWPSPIEVGSLSHYLEGFSNIPGGDRWISEPSTVCHSMSCGMKS